jgi:hypothetical protein
VSFATSYLPHREAHTTLDQFVPFCEGTGQTVELHTTRHHNRYATCDWCYMPVNSLGGRAIPHLSLRTRFALEGVNVGSHVAAIELLATVHTPPKTWR